MAINGLLLCNILHITLKLLKWGLNHFQDKNLYHSINHLIFCVQNLSDLKYISYDLFKNRYISIENVNIEIASLILLENGLRPLLG